MTKTLISEKYNDACIRVFALISLLVQGEAPFSEVIKLFADKNGKISQKANVILNKYMNTLKIFGIEVKKKKGIYQLHKMSFSITFGEEELYAVSLIRSVLAFIPDNETKNEILKFIAELEKRYDYKTKKLNVIVKSTRNYDLSFYFMKFRQQISDCEKYCSNRNKIKICYIDNDGNDCNIIAIAQEIKYHQNNVCLSVYSNITHQIIDIPVDTIKSISDLGKDDCSDKKYIAVTFKIKGDLAKRYKLRDWERIKSKDEDSTLTIINSGEDLNTLATRLFKYDRSCVIISPKYFKMKLVKMINSTLSNYNE